MNNNIKNFYSLSSAAASTIKRQTTTFNSNLIRKDPQETNKIIKKISNLINDTMGSTLSGKITKNMIPEKTLAKLITEITSKRKHRKHEASTQHPVLNLRIRKRNYNNKNNTILIKIQPPTSSHPKVTLNSLYRQSPMLQSTNTCSPPVQFILQDLQAHLQSKKKN